MQARLCQPVEAADGPLQPPRPGLVALDGTHVLIVDDDPISREILQEAVRALGVGRISLAGDGLECLAILDAEAVPDLILLDVMMPNLDGYETCRRIRLRENLRDLPVVVQTALDSPSDHHHCFEVGATDVVTKPLYPPEMRARLRVHLENRLMMRSLQHFRARLTDELDVASRMQASILPDTAQLREQLASLRIRFDAHYQPCAEIGGDLWQVMPLDDRYVAVLVLDLAGHGLIAAINAFRVHGLLPLLVEQARDPASWLAGLNGLMAAELGATVLATGLYGLIDLVEQRFSYASAGAPPPLLGTRTGVGWSVAPLPSSGLMLGMLPDTDYPVRQVPFGKGDVLFLYSDGLSRDTDDAEIAIEKLAGIVATSMPRDGQPALAELLRILPSHARRDDDVMLLWLGRQD